MAKRTTKKLKLSKQEDAIERTILAQEKIKQIENLLKHTLDIDDAIDWETLKYKDNFSWQPPLNNHIIYDQITGYPERVVLKKRLPLPEGFQFFQKISFLQKILGQTEKIKTKQKELFEAEISKIKKENKDIDKNNDILKNILYDQQRLWNTKKSDFEESQNNNNSKIDSFKEKYQKKDSDSIIEYCEMVLNNSVYPEKFLNKFELQYNEINGMLLVDYHLPSINLIPILHNVRYIKSRDEIEEKTLSQSAHTKLYDDAIYQIILRTFHELFEADIIDAIKAINFNGFVTATNQNNGHMQTNCIVSIQVSKLIFENINLKGIVHAKSFKECFKSLKGISSSTFSSITSIKPILEFDKSDKRFREHYEVANSLNDEINIAAMNWEDFEHLVREIFEKEFSQNGGEVKITQASSDGGVDAIAFDPDPLRGGKIVIQAKRYTNTVGISAVRDLYGTIMNEGATKGILVTTADYGAESYAFAKDKPITLLNGSHLLHLLEKHGHKAKIDIKEAKKILKEKNS